MRRAEDMRLLAFGRCHNTDPGSDRNPGPAGAPQLLGDAGRQRGFGARRPGADERHRDQRRQSQLRPARNHRPIRGQGARVRLARGRGFCRDLGRSIPARLPATAGTLLPASPASHPQQKAAEQSGDQTRRRRGPVSVATSGIVFSQSGHQHSFHGQAYIPQLVPQGVQTSDIR